MAFVDTLTHTKKKWHREIRDWNELSRQYYELSKQLKVQQARIHKAYTAYIKLKDA